MIQNIDYALTKAQQACHRTGLRLTDKRYRILQLMLQTDIPLSAYDIAERYKINYGATLPVVSAYRMLGFLLQAELAHKLDTTNQYLACSHIVCEHEHAVPQFLICDQCHAVQEVALRKQVLDELKSSVESSGFLLTNKQLELHGFCEHCQRKKMEYIQESAESS